MIALGCLRHIRRFNRVNRYRHWVGLYSQTWRALHRDQLTKHKAWTNWRGDGFFERCEVRTGLGSRYTIVGRMSFEEAAPIDGSWNDEADFGVCPERKGRGLRRASMQPGRKG
jgi:hypothetical protein